MSKSPKAKYCIGQLIQHKLFDYRGIILSVDLEFKSTDEWYEAVAKSRPPKNEPWYHVLVHQAEHATYVAERNLEADSSSTPIEHPLVDQYCFPKLKTIMSGAAPLGPELAEACAKRLGCTVKQGYGLTEASPVITVSSSEQVKRGSVGKPLKDVEVQLADDGEIITRGPHVMAGY